MHAFTRLILASMKMFHMIGRVGYLNRVDKETALSVMFLPSLIISNFATSTLGILAALFLIDMSVTFGVDRGIMGQINTVSSIFSIIFALAMGILSIRLSHRTLILTGMLAYSISAIGCYLAWDLNSILTFYSLNGVALAMVVPMTNSLIGENMVLERRASAVGWTVAAGSLAYFIGAPLMGVLSGFGGWRTVLLSFIIPIALLALLIMGTAIPSAKKNARASVTSEAYSNSFIKIALNKSAIGCLIGTIFRFATFAALLFYGTAFTIERFDLSIDFASIVILVAALSYTIGSLTCSPVIKKVGRRSTTVVAVLLAGLFTISYAFAPSIWLSVTLMSVAGWFNGLAASASTNLTLEQMPKLRGTMMSLQYAFVSIGSTIGAAIGGLTLILYDYKELGIILGSMGIIAAIIFQFATTDPTESTVIPLQDQH
jgi:predicted MFS family arabinose efflux permease